MSENLRICPLRHHRTWVKRDRRPIQIVGSVDKQSPKLYMSTKGNAFRYDVHAMRWNEISTEQAMSQDGISTVYRWGPVYGKYVKLLQL